MPTDVPPRSGKKDDEKPGAADPTRDERIERLAREMAHEVEGADAENREELRHYAADVMRDEAESARVHQTTAARGRRRRMGPLAFAFLLLGAGVLFLLLLPPVGVVMLIAAAAAFVWGLIRLAISDQGRPSDPPKT